LEVFEPLAFLGVHFLFVKHDASFFIRGHWAPCILGVCFLFVKYDASFFFGGLWASCIFRGVFLIRETWCLFFHRRSSYLGLAYQFVRRLSLWARGLIARLCSWLCYSMQKRLSNTELTLLAILTLWPHVFGEWSFYCCFRVHMLRLVKNLTHFWVSPVGKRVRASESKCTTLCSTMKARL
jgi:hypothetical protein